MALWAGDLPRYMNMLREHIALHALDVWRTCADSFLEIRIRQKNTLAGIALLDRAIRSLEAAGFVLYNDAFEGVLAEGLVACKRHEEADKLVSRATVPCWPRHASSALSSRPRLGLSERMRQRPARFVLVRFAFRATYDHTSDVEIAN
jgi:hypothetical protein